MRNWPNSSLPTYFVIYFCSIIFIDLAGGKKSDQCDTQQKCYVIRVHEDEFVERLL